MLLLESNQFCIRLLHDHWINDYFSTAAHPAITQRINPGWDVNIKRSWRGKCLVETINSILKGNKRIIVMLSNNLYLDRLINKASSAHSLWSFRELLAHWGPLKSFLTSPCWTAFLSSRLSCCRVLAVRFGWVHGCHSMVVYEPYEVVSMGQHLPVTHFLSGILSMPGIRRH